MKNVNELVQAVRTEGTESIAYSELFTTIYNETIVPKAESFERQLKGDVAEGIDEGIKLFMELVESWDGTGNFHSLFKTSYTNRLKNLIKYLNRDKRKHNTSYDVSLSGSVEKDGEASPILEVINDSSLHTSFDITDEKNKLEVMIDKFAEKHPEQADLITIMMNFSDDTKKSEQTKTYCEYYGVQSYTSVIQKRVSRARESFKKFLLNNNFQVVLV